MGCAPAVKSAGNKVCTSPLFSFVSPESDSGISSFPAPRDSAESPLIAVNIIAIRYRFSVLGSRFWVLAPTPTANANSRRDGIPLPSLGSRLPVGAGHYLHAVFRAYDQVAFGSGPFDEV